MVGLRYLLVLTLSDSDGDSSDRQNKRLVQITLDTLEGSICGSSELKFRTQFYLNGGKCSSWKPFKRKLLNFFVAMT